MLKKYLACGFLVVCLLASIGWSFSASADQKDPQQVTSSSPKKNKEKKEPKEDKTEKTVSQLVVTGFKSK